MSSTAIVCCLLWLSALVVCEQDLDDRAIRRAGLSEAQAEAVRIIAHDRTTCDLTSAGACGLVHFQPCPGWPMPVVEQLGVWRRRVGWGERLANEHGWYNDLAVLALIIANSTGVRGFEVLADRCLWDVSCVVSAYSTSRHRSERVARWRQ